MKRLLGRWLPVILWMIVIYLGSSIGHVPRVGGETVDGIVHRLGHLIEFAILGALIWRAVSNGTRALTRRDMIIVLIVVTLYGASDEWHQRFVVGRSSEFMAVVFDVAGGAIGAVMWRWSRPGRSRSMPIRRD